jgi:2-hydroxycyclohexanecarboxyl-CoA dehydrogenase
MTTGRVAVVTGGASGVGLGSCRHLVGVGHRVAVLDVDGDAADPRARGGDVFAAQVDVSSRPGVDAAPGEVRARLGPVHMLVTSAATVGFAPSGEITVGDWDRIISVDLTATFHCPQAAVPDMAAARWGRIVTISSTVGQIGSPRQAHYAAAKGGGQSGREQSHVSMAAAWTPRAVRVNAVASGAVRTEMLLEDSKNYGLDEAAPARATPWAGSGNPTRSATPCFLRL